MTHRKPANKRALPEDDSILLTVTEVAHFLGVHENTVTIYAKTGAIPRPIRLGSGKRRFVRWRVGDLRLWIEAGGK